MSRAAALSPRWRNMHSCLYFYDLVKFVADLFFSAGPDIPWMSRRDLATWRRRAARRDLRAPLLGAWGMFLRCAPPSAAPPGVTSICLRRLSDAMALAFLRVEIARCVYMSAIPLRYVSSISTISAAGGWGVVTRAFRPLIPTPFNSPYYPLIEYAPLLIWFDRVRMRPVGGAISCNFFAAALCIGACIHCVVRREAQSAPADYAVASIRLPSRSTGIPPCISS